MPIYEYLCRRCNRIYAFLYATMGDRTAPCCPRCGASGLESSVSLFAFVRGGTDPLAAIPKSEEAPSRDEAPAETDPALGGSSDGSAAPPVGHPTRDPGLYRHDWDGRYDRLRERREI